jgi:[NiFe] hydrogenase assembly HybE family chaperone
MSDEAALCALEAGILAAFTHIARVRMAGIPLLNPALDVAMRGLQSHEPWQLGILVTPWFMNLLAFPAEAETRRVGTKMPLALPSGSYEAIWSHEEALGGYWAVSLFSPMDDFADMATAIATADAALAEIMTMPEPEPAPAPKPQPAVSRRALFRLGDEAQSAQIAS